MLIIPKDYMTLQIRLYVPGHMDHWGRITACIEITQPCGYTQKLKAPVQLVGKQANIHLRYPLMDDGAWEQVEGFCKATDYKMCVYTVKVDLLSDGQHIVSETGVLDQEQLYANSVKTRIRTDFPPGFIECAPRRPVCIDHNQVPVSIRLKSQRVDRCRVRMDVSARHGDKSLVEPITMDLVDEAQDVIFDHTGWARGEYWIRVQVIEEGQPVGPYMVRKFWKEVIGPEPQPEPPLRLGTALQYMVDGWLFESSQGLDFWPMSYDPNPDKPAVVMDKPWEYGVFSIKDLKYDKTDQCYKMQYTTSIETFRRRAHAWQFLVDQIDAGSATQPQPWEELEKGAQRTLVFKPDEDRQFDDEILGNLISQVSGVEPTDTLQQGYLKLLWAARQLGVPVQPFNIPPEGTALAILPNVLNTNEQNTDYLALAIPGTGAEAQLPPPDQVDMSKVEIYEMYPEDLQQPEYICLATSKDGVTWRKPELGLVAFHGSTANNILKTVEDEDRACAREAETHAIRPNTERYKHTFRLYDPDKDGPVDMDMVFMSFFAKGQNEKIDFMVPDDLADSPALGFMPESSAYYPMMYAGNGAYLFLSAQPFIYLGSGMDLMHSSESIRCQIERRDGDSPTIFWYYRPNTPGYPPHNWPCDNHQGPLRNLAVIWTNDGIHYEKRSCICPDEHDPPGMQFYNMNTIGPRPEIHQGRTMLRRSSAPGSSFPQGQLIVGELRCYDSAQQTQYPELIWTRDLLHWHRFTDHRAPLLKLGEKDGSYNWGMYFQGQSYFPFKDKDGHEAWWLYNIAVGARHCHRAIAFHHPTVASVQAQYPHYSEAPFFTDWRTLFERAQRCLYLPQFTHIRPGRLAYTAPIKQHGEFVTWPILFDGTRLVLNIDCQATGSLSVEVQNEVGDVLNGYSLEECNEISDDVIAVTPSWLKRNLAELSGQVLKFRIVLDNARLFTLHIE